MNKYKVTIALILTNSPAKTFVVKAKNIVDAQMRVLKKTKSWYRIISAEQSVNPTMATCPKVK